MNATIYHFSKDNRSTARPTGGTSITGIVFKENTSRENPILKITKSALNNDYEWNYINILGNYYYINDIVFLNNDIFELHCSIDVLATYKTEIEASTQYVVRSTHGADKNGYIPDNAYPMTNSVSYEHAVASSTNWLTNFGTAVLGVLGPNAGDTTTFYEMSTLRLTTLIRALYAIDVTQELSIATIELGLLKTLYDPIKYMTSCILLPYTYSGTGNTSTISCGYIDLPLGDEVVKRVNSNEGRGFTTSITYSDHPQAATRGKYLNNSPYTQRLLTVMPFGTFNIDCSKLNDFENKLRLEITCTKSDGNAMLEVYTLPTSSGNRNTLFWSNAQLGVHVPLYQSDSIFKQTFSLLGQQTSVISSALTGNFAAIPGSCAQWINTVNTAHAPEVHMVGGSSGSFLISATSTVGGISLPRLDSTFYEVVPVDNNLGYMVCDNKVLGNMNGFNICQNSRIALNAPSVDIEAVKNYMNSGIIIP